MLRGSRCPISVGTLEDVDLPWFMSGSLDTSPTYIVRLDNEAEDISLRPVRTELLRPTAERTRPIQSMDLLGNAAGSPADVGTLMMIPPGAPRTVRAYRPGAAPPHQL
jgi:hypothetical protein